jgi:hypothetical protein
MKPVYSTPTGDRVATFNPATAAFDDLEFGGTSGRGGASITDPDVLVQVAHGLPETPLRGEIQVTPRDTEEGWLESDCSKFAVRSFDHLNFTIEVDVPPGEDALTNPRTIEFDWLWTPAEAFVSPEVFLYNEGTENVAWQSVTPWQSVNYVAGNWTATKESDHLYLNQNAWVSGNNTSASFRTTDLIDLSLYATLVIEFTHTTTGAQKRRTWQATTGDTGSGGTVHDATGGTGARTEFNFDVSEIGDSRYIFVAAQSMRSSSGGSDGVNQLQVHRVYLIPA